MIALAEVQKLALREKLALMEALWESLAQQEDQLEVPEWHKEILDEREKLIQEGKANFIDWEAAKQEIKQATS